MSIMLADLRHTYNYNTEQQYGDEKIILCNQVSWWSLRYPVITGSTLQRVTTERIDEKNIKAPTATSSRPTTSEVAWCFLGDNAALPPAYRVKVEKCASFVDVLDVGKFTTFCDRKGYTSPPLTSLRLCH